MRSEVTKKTKQISGDPSPTSRERSFDLSLSAVIRGSNAGGSEFEEKTQLVSISAQEAVFTLKSPLLISSRVQLVLNVPRTLILGQRFYLQISGEVVAMESIQNGRKSHLITISLDKPYKIGSPS